MESITFDPVSDQAFFLAFQRLALAELPPPRLRALLEAAHGDPVRALREPARGVLNDRQSQRFRETGQRPIPADVLSAAARSGVRVVYAGSGSYPTGLLPFPDSPPFLFFRGELDASVERSVAVVGSRRASGYGREQAAHFAGALATAGLTVISGGAAGVDTSAHAGVLRAGGRTIAIVACGLDYVYPAQNRQLFEDIVGAGGAIASEFALGVRPEPWRFPARNRIIAGIAQVTLVIEAPEASGALLTAQFAADYGRDVFVVPGPVDTGRSRGGHLLLRDGAGIADRPEEVLAAFCPTARRPEEPCQAQPIVDSLTGVERALLECLGHEPRHPDAVGPETALTAGQISTAATLLELKGLIGRVAGGGLFRR